MQQQFLLSCLSVTRDGYLDCCRTSTVKSLEVQIDPSDDAQNDATIYRIRSFSVTFSSYIFLSIIFHWLSLFFFLLLLRFFSSFYFDFSQSFVNRSIIGRQLYDEGGERIQQQKNEKERERDVSKFSSIKYILLFDRTFFLFTNRPTDE